MTKTAVQHQIPAGRNKVVVNRMMSVEVDIWFVQTAQLAADRNLPEKNVVTLKVTKMSYY